MCAPSKSCGVRATGRGTSSDPGSIPPALPAAELSKKMAERGANSRPPTLGRLRLTANLFPSLGFRHGCLYCAGATNPATKASGQVNSVLAGMLISDCRVGHLQTVCDRHPWRRTRHRPCHARARPFWLRTTEGLAPASAPSEQKWPLTVIRISGEFCRLNTRISAAMLPRLAPTIASFSSRDDGTA